MDVKVNAAEWKALSADDQKKVQDILLATGLLKVGAKLAPDAAAPASGQLVAAGLWDDIKKPLCQAACTAAEGVAAGACVGLGPILGPLCIVAAHTAGDACRNSC